MIKQNLSSGKMCNEKSRVFLQNHDFFCIKMSLPCHFLVTSLSPSIHSKNAGYKFDTINTK